MASTVAYFLKNTIYNITALDLNKSAWSQSVTIFNIPVMLIELYILYATYHALKNYILLHSNILSMPILICYCMFAVIIIIDILDNLRVVIILDMKRYLQFDFYYISHEYGQDYSYWAKIDAYRLDHKCNTSICTICQDAFSDDPPNTRKQLIKCGHLYHKNCIEKWEHFEWNKGHGSIQSNQAWGPPVYCECTNCTLNNEHHWLYPYCACPLCKRRYHSHFTKFDYNENYWQQQGVSTSLWVFPGAKGLQKMIWGRRTKQYNAWTTHVDNHTDWSNSWRVKFHQMYNQY
eukprot:242208_1